MKKLLILGTLVILGCVAFGITANKAQSASSETKDKVVLFGKVDFSDDDKVDSYSPTEEEAEDSNEGDWLENFIATHKTPFTKTVTK
ncbi:hypothetical protein ACQRDX_04230 [Streptococcus sp. SGI.013]|uniref:Lipoprotein n=1 Tax=Streptococcus porcorum TaxID=701526 RepID=A0ABV2JFP1_9STRE